MDIIEEEKMTPEIFLKKSILSSINTSRQCVDNFVNEAIDKYKKNDFTDVVDLVEEYREKIKTHLALLQGSTVINFSNILNICPSTARKKLNSLVDMELVNVDKTKREFKYKLINQKEKQC